MKMIQKYLCLLVFTAALVCIVVLAAPQAAEPLPCFVVQGVEGAPAQNISTFDANNGNYYVFLPSYADLDQVTVFLPQSQTFGVDEIPLSDAMDCSRFELETPYVFTRDQQQIGALWFFRSANVATLYIDTVSGNMKYLHQNKDHKETASVLLYTTEGKIGLSDERSTLTGRGNASWEYDKRPYTLTLSADASVLDMAPAAKWVLLANAADETNLNNKLVMDLASRVGTQWVPESRWVDLYLNGEYSGLYLLTEKIEVHGNRLAIDTDSGDFLCRIDLDERWATLQNPFSTGAGRTVEISAPKILKEGDQSHIESRVRALEQEIFSGADLRKSTVLDLDSWVRRYLIDEISANIDADLASSYFYCSDGILFAGPLWDYDMTLGNFPRNQDPHAFIAKNPHKSDSLHSAYYGALYQNESFHDRMVEIYRTEFTPVLQELLNGEIDYLIDFLRDASQANSLRWRSMYDHLPADVVHTPSALKDYFSRRIRFLDSAWLDNRVYCTVQFESSPGSAYKNVSVEKGSCLQSAYINTETVLWMDTETGELFDFSQPVRNDRILSKYIPEGSGS